MPKPKIVDSAHCVECGGELGDFRHGWLSLNTGYRSPNARVHTTCRAAFEKRPQEERQEMAKQQWDQGGSDD